jgi:A/G-specific adenine glycosylase
MADVSSPDPARRDAIRGDLLAWYDVNRRVLPWRALPGETPDPYRVWLSEIMLQQTTVPHAIPYFLAFTRRWPSVRDLADEADAAVMSAWAGLGYYARARNLLACARAVTRDHAGEFPASEADLRLLPGVGAYTAAAIAAIAFSRRANVVDGNVERVVARLFAVEDPLPKAKPRLNALAESLVESERAADWPQALMDLGSTVCRPRSPSCEVCPVEAHCLAAATGDPAAFPVKTKRAPRPHRYGAVYVLRSGDAVALVERPAKGLLGGMLGLPTTAWRDAPWREIEAAAAAPAPREWRDLGEIDHVFTHFALTLRVLGATTPFHSGDMRWLPLIEARSALPSLFRKALALWGDRRAAG